MNTWVVVPTYNERDNVEALLSALFRLPLVDLHVLIVDDASPDGTGTLVESLRERFPALAVLHRSGKSGLASAYGDGFRYALGHGASYVVQMDADFSHDPAVVPALLHKAQEGADLVVGSRYIHGGRIVNWNWTRRLVSRCGNWYARTVLGTTVHDLTSGMKCFRRSALEAVRLEAISSTGYNFQIEMTWKALCAGLVVRELPITFTERRLGRSKFHLGIILESMVGVWRLRNVKYKMQNSK